MTSTTFAAEMARNRVAYQQLRDHIRRTEPGQYAAIAQGRLIAVTETFDESVSAVRRLKPAPEHFLVFPVDEEPAFDVIDDFFGSP